MCCANCKAVPRCSTCRLRLRRCHKQSHFDCTTKGIEMRVALITGASSGIGLAASRAFLDAGIAVVGVARNAEKLAAMERNLAGLRAPLVTLALDVTADDAPQRAVGLAMDKFGRLDHLVNNAGIGSPKPVHETDDATLDYYLGLMLRAPFRFCREALKV